MQQPFCYSHQRHVTDVGMSVYFYTPVPLLPSCDPGKEKQNVNTFFVYFLSSLEAIFIKKQHNAVMKTKSMYSIDVVWLLFLK